VCVLVEDAAESILSVHFEVVESAGIGDGLWWWARGCCVVQGAVGSVLVVEWFELAEGVEGVCVVPHQGVVEEFVPAGLYPPFHDGVYSGDADAGGDDLDVLPGEDRVECLGERAVAVLDQVLRRRADVLGVHGEVSCGLGDPCGGGVVGGVEDADAATGVLEGGEDVVQYLAPLSVVAVKKSQATMA